MGATHNNAEQSKDSWFTRHIPVVSGPSVSSLLALVTFTSDCVLGEGRRCMCRRLYRWRQRCGPLLHRAQTPAGIQPDTPWCLLLTSSGMCSLSRLRIAYTDTYSTPVCRGSMCRLKALNSLNCRIQNWGLALPYQGGRTNPTQTQETQLWWCPMCCQTDQPAGVCCKFRTLYSKTSRCKPSRLEPVCFVQHQRPNRHGQRRVHGQRLLQLHHSDPQVLRQDGEHSEYSSKGCRATLH